MTQDEVLAEFSAAGASLHGHFILSSGRRSAVLLQKMMVFRSPARTEKLCRALAGLITDAFGRVDLIVSPRWAGSSRATRPACARLRCDLFRARGRRIRAAA